MDIPQLIQGLTSLTVNSFPFDWNKSSARKLVMNKFSWEIRWLQWCSGTVLW